MFLTKEEAIKRGASEEFVNARGFNNHQINVIYKGIYVDEIKYEKFIGLEGDWCHYEWIDINKLDNYG